MIDSEGSGAGGWDSGPASQPPTVDPIFSGPDLGVIEPIVITAPRGDVSNVPFDFSLGFDPFKGQVDQYGAALPVSETFYGNPFSTSPTFSQSLNPSLGAINPVGKLAPPAYSPLPGPKSAPLGILDKIGKVLSAVGAAAWNVVKTVAGAVFDLIKALLRNFTFGGKIDLSPSGLKKAASSVLPTLINPAPTSGGGPVITLPAPAASGGVNVSLPQGQGNPSPGIPTPVLLVGLVLVAVTLVGMRNKAWRPS